MYTTRIHMVLVYYCFNVRRSDDRQWLYLLVVLLARHLRGVVGLDFLNHAREQCAQVHEAQEHHAATDQQNNDNARVLIAKQDAQCAEQAVRDRAPKAFS